MNVIDRSFPNGTDPSGRKLAAAGNAHWHKIVLAVAVALVLAAVAFYVWVTTLCGDCGGPALLPPPPA